tara:strand:+ start:380 stop:520 length:141 start_codon:yes stop_codon:yes gene_type:complete
MSNTIDPNKDYNGTEANSQFSEGGIFVREDDQDWGSSGMNDIKDLE